MNREIVKLPLIINGKNIQPKAGDDVYRFIHQDLELVLPKVDIEKLKKLEDLSEFPISKLTVNEILEFLGEVGKLWRDKDYKYRRLLEELGPRHTGEPRGMYDLTINLLTSITSFKSYAQDMIEAELPNRRVLDEWVPHYDSYVRALPLGNLLHIVAGNVPLASIYTLIRGLFTKNTNICKLPGRDVLSLLLFALSFQDVSKDHPVTKSISVVYWEKSEEEKIDYATSIANGICIWGGGETVKYYKAKVQAGTEIIEYGPKTGLQVIQWDDKSAKDLHLRVARDICVYGQEACFNPQIIYILGDADGFIEKLEEGLNIYKEIWPKEHRNIDHYAHMNFFKIANEFNGSKTKVDENRKWLIVKTTQQDNDTYLEHPLGRTVYVHPIQDPKECLKYIDKRVQTVGIEPKSLAFQLRENLVQLGVLRIANVGYVEGPRLGLSHDGVTLHKLIRMVGMERDIEYFSKAYDVPDDYEDFELEFLKYTKKDPNL